MAAIKAKVRYDGMTPEQKAARQDYLREWMAKNPQRVEVYKSRKPEYDRRYLYGRSDRSQDT
jgi:hypothetical protein